MPPHPPYFEIARYLISYSHSDSTLRISAASMSSSQARITALHERIMADRYPAGRGVRYGFGWSRMANHEQPFHADEHRVLGYPNTLLNNEGSLIPPPMSFTAGIPVGTPVAAHELFNSPRANDDRRRRSSSLSPRTIRASICQTPWTPFFPSSHPQTPTPPGSHNFANHTTQAQAVAEPNTQAFNRTSLSTVTATARTSTSSSFTETTTGTRGHYQRAIFALLSEICNEALRRKWHDEIQHQSIRSLATDRSRSSWYHRRSRGRYSPYTTLSAVIDQHSNTSQRAQRTGATSPPREQPFRFMELIQRIATAMWECAIQPHHQSHGAQNVTNGAVPESRPAPTRGESEIAAIDSMRTLYSLGNSIMAATSAAASCSEHFNLDEVRDIVGVAAGFCRILGYGEGAERCEEVGRRLLWEVEWQERGWEEGVL